MNWLIGNVLGLCLIFIVLDISRGTTKFLWLDVGIALLCISYFLRGLDNGSGGG